jgi:prevent-host-death family protein
VANRTNKRTNPPTAAKRLPAWKLEDAKARFSELVRRAQSQGPQRVTRRGETAVVVVGAEDFERLAPARATRGTLVEFLQRTRLGEIDVERELDRGREPPA